ncbi:hypothetical protein [Streptomyces sp. NPDC093544]|uniref:hypothetical protein n=1 Tax=Streptomyces sp. NPDC093544 TaxID=3155200 RepID=UPI0034160D4B
MDTISKQYEQVRQYKQHPQNQQHPQVPQNQQHDDSNPYQDGYEGGGAPWES